MNSMFPFDKDQVVKGKPIQKIPYLIYRCNIKEKPELPEGFTFDNLVGLQYMGAAEYEFGAAPASLQQYVYHLVDGSRKFITFKWREHEFYVLSASGEYEDPLYYEGLLEDLFTRQRQTKMGTHLDYFLEGKTQTRVKRGCKHKMETVPNYGYTNFWWDIENHFMIWPVGEDLPPQALEDAFQNLRNKGWNVPPWYKKPAMVSHLVRSVTDAILGKDKAK